MGKLNISVPNRPKPTYAEACKCRYSYPLPFTSFQIRFAQSRSKNYKTAVFICSILPEHETASADNNYINSLYVSSENDFGKYYDAIYELFMLISKWKQVEFTIGNELCYPDEFWLYICCWRRYSTYKGEQFDIKLELKIFKCKWENEKRLFYIIRDMFDGCTIHYHYRSYWLDNLELDMYIEELNLGIEYQGIQHYTPLEHWGGEEGFIKRRTNDIKKKNLCLNKGVTLVYFTYMNEITPELVSERLSEYI
jgi:hypothetical protein